MFALGQIVDQVSQDEGCNGFPICYCNVELGDSQRVLTGRHNEDVGAEATDHVGHTVADGSGEGALLEGRQLVGDDAVHLGQVAEVGSIQDRGQTHGSGCNRDKR